MPLMTKREAAKAFVDLYDRLYGARLFASQSKRARIEHVMKRSTRDELAKEVYRMRQELHKREGNPARGGWIKTKAVRIRRDSRGKPVAVDLKVPRGTKIRNIEGYMDEEGRFRPIRGSKGYREKKSQKPGVRVARARGKGWTYRKTKKGWVARGPRGGRYGPFKTKREAMKGRR